MKTNQFRFLCLAVFGLILSLSQASATLYSFSSSPETSIPDGNSAGVTSAINVGGIGNILSSGDNVSVILNVSGGNMGDLYAYLTYNGTTVVLLNRPGTGGNPSSLGYVGGSLNNVTLTDGGLTSIDSYGGGATSGSYNPSGGSIVFQNYNSISPDGTWTLFFADLSGGDSSASTLNSWTLDITAVPEPINVALPIFGGLLFAIGLFRRFVGSRQNGSAN